MRLIHLNERRIFGLARTIHDGMHNRREVLGCGLHAAFKQRVSDFFASLLLLYDLKVQLGSIGDAFTQEGSGWHFSPRQRSGQSGPETVLMPGLRGLPWGKFWVV